MQINRIFHNSISISFFFIVFVLFFLEGIERIVERNIIIRCCTNFKNNSSTCVCFQREQCTQNSRAYSFPATFERVWVRLTRDRFPSTKTNIPGRSSMFFPQTTIERVGEMKNRMGRKRRTDKRRKDGGGRGRDKRNSRNIYLGGFILRSRLFYFGHAFLGQFFSNRSDAVIRDSMHAGDSTRIALRSLSLSLSLSPTLRNTPDLSVFIS